MFKTSSFYFDQNIWHNIGSFTWLNIFKRSSVKWRFDWKSFPLFRRLLERMFSAMGFIQDDLRNRLGVDKLEKLAFTNRILSSSWTFHFVPVFFNTFWTFKLIFLNLKSVFCNPGITRNWTIRDIRVVLFECVSLGLHIPWEGFFALRLLWMVALPLRTTSFHVLLDVRHRNEYYSVFEWLHKTTEVRNLLVMTEMSDIDVDGANGASVQYWPEWLPKVK